MWQADGELIQIEVGSDIIKAATKPDERGWLAKNYFGESPPQLGQILVELTHQLRQRLQAMGSFLPLVQYRDANDLPSNGVRIYVGLEMQQLRIQSLEDLMNFLASKVLEYNAYSPGKDSIRKLLSVALEDVRQDYYQYAYEKYQLAYYHSSLQGYEFEAIRCLSDAGNIRLKNGAYDHALAMFWRAAALSNSPNVVDANIRAQAGIHLANTLKVLQRYEESLSACITSVNIAYHAGNSSLLFLALASIAETHYMNGSYESASQVLELATELILSQSTLDKYQLAINLQQTTIRIYQQITNEMKQTHQPSSKPQSTPFQDLMKLILPAIVQSVVGAVVCKLFNVGGVSLLSIFGTSTYDISKSVFHGPAVIGDNNIQRLS